MILEGKTLLYLIIKILNGVSILILSLWTSNFVEYLSLYIYTVNFEKCEKYTLISELVKKMGDDQLYIRFL